jgi:hypothetical protein
MTPAQLVEQYGAAVREGRPLDCDRMIDEAGNCQRELRRHANLLHSQGDPAWQQAELLLCYSLLRFSSPIEVITASNTMRMRGGSLYDVLVIQGQAWELMQEYEGALWTWLAVASLAYAPAAFQRAAELLTWFEAKGGRLVFYPGIPATAYASATDPALLDMLNRSRRMASFSFPAMPQGSIPESTNTPLKR